MTMTHSQLGLPESLKVTDDTRRKFRSMIRKAADKIQQGYTLVGGVYTFATFTVKLEEDGRIVITDQDGSSALVGTEPKRTPKAKSSTSKPLTTVDKQPKAEKSPKSSKRQQVMFPNKERIIKGFDEFVREFDNHLQQHHERVAINFNDTWYSFMMEQLYLGSSGDVNKAHQIVLHKLEQRHITPRQYVHLIDNRMIGFGPVNKQEG